MKFSYAVFICVTALVVALVDGVLKFAAIRTFPSDNTPLNPIFDLALHKNPGIVFDLNIPLSIILPITAVLCIALLHQAWTLQKTSPLSAASLVVIVIGALGNAVDRMVNGFTTDYLIFFRLTAINLSDILILAGIVLYFIYNKGRLPTIGANF